MEKLKQLCLASLVAALLGLNSTVPALAQDGGDDGGLDDGGADDAGTATTIRATTRTRTAMGSRIRMGMGMGTATREGTDTMENIITIMSIHIMAAGRPGVSALARSAICPPTTRRRIPAIRLQPAGSFRRGIHRAKRQPAQPATASQANYWHYCRSAEGYYPYVKECPDGWEQVAPTPQAGNDDQE